jgi:raffinose/stachyose/melibiose transport system substrate-binding protein
LPALERRRFVLTSRKVRRATGRVGDPQVLVIAPVFEKYGWKPPTNLNDTEELFKEAAGRGIQPLTAGNADWRPANEWLVTMMWNHYAGPDALYQALTGQVKWSDPVFVEPIALLGEWFKKGYIGKSPSDYFTTHFNTVYENLASGVGAMYWSGTWELANLPDYFGPAAHNDATWTWANLPQMQPSIPKVVNELSIGGTYSINTNSGDPEGTAQYLSWQFANRKAYAEGLKLFGIEPAPLPFVESDWLSGTNPNDSRVYNELNVTSKQGNVGYTTWTFWPPKSDNYIIQQMDGIITGALTAKHYCAGLDPVFQAELKAGLVPPLFKPRAYAAL